LVLEMSERPETVDPWLEDELLGVERLGAA
jgi:hypothetical protein